MKNRILVFTLMLPVAAFCQTFDHGQTNAAHEAELIQKRILELSKPTSKPSSSSLHKLVLENIADKKLTVDQLKSLKAGGVDAGGGNSVEGENGKRRLLDLEEKEKFEYFVPGISYGNQHFVSHGMATLFTHSYLSFNGCPDLNNELKGFTNEDFLKIFATAYGLDRLKLNVNIQWCSNQVIARFDYNKIKWEQHNQKLIIEGKLPEFKQLLWAFVDVPLETIEDSGLIRVENPETKIQVALQSGHLVVINKEEFYKMDAESQNALFVHEAALYAVKLLNPGLIEELGTAPIRIYVQRLIRYFNNWAIDRNGKPLYPAEPVRESFNNLQIKKIK